jgi:hypothetical protein
VYAPKPPVACNACEYKAFTCPLGKDAVRIVSGATTDTFATLPVKPWADAVMVADARFGPPVIWAPVAGVVDPESMNTLGETVTMFGSLLESVIVTPWGAGAARLTENGTVCPGATVALGGRTMVPALPTVTFAVPLVKRDALPVMVAEPTAAPVTVKVPVLLPAEIGTLTGDICTALDGTDVRATVTPPAGAGTLKLMVPPV